MAQRSGQQVYGKRTSLKIESSTNNSSSVNLKHDGLPTVTDSLGASDSPRGVSLDDPFDLAKSEFAPNYVFEKQRNYDLKSKVETISSASSLRSLSCGKSRETIPQPSVKRGSLTLNPSESQESLPPLPPSKWMCTYAGRGSRQRLSQEETDVVNSCSIYIYIYIYIYILLLLLLQCITKVYVYNFLC